MKKLTKKQRIVLDFIKDFMLDNGYAPSVREIGIGLNLSSPATIHGYLKRLKEKDYIDYKENKSRTIIIHYKDEQED